MQTARERWLVGALVAVVAAAAAFMWHQLEAPAEEPAANAGLAALPASHPAPSAPAPPSRASARPTAVLVEDASLPLAVHVERLLASRDPRQAYTAYMLVWSCARFNDRHDLAVHDSKLGASRPLNAGERQDMAKVCGAMTERERLARLDYLAIAVKAGVPGAAWAFAVEGPFGDPSALKTRPGDPLVQEWKATAVAQLRQAAEAGDPLTLMVWGLENLSGSDLTDKQPALGYTYLLANGLIQGDRFGAKHVPAQTYADGSPLMNAMANALTPEQRAAAMVAARRLADKVKARRQRGE